jgi:CIC family chloride channel protein
MSNDLSAVKEAENEEKAGSLIVERGEKQNQARRRLFPHALIVGVLTGAIAVAFRVCLEHGEAVRGRLIEYSHSAPAGILWMFVASTLLVGVALLLVKRFCPEASGSGIPHLRMTLSERGQLDWKRIIPIKFVSGFLGIFSGLCLGREGPTIQMGASLGAMWGGSHLGKSTDRRTLYVTGASAGLGAAFNAPMAGILFSIEELHIGVPDSAFFAAMISCITSDLLARFALGQTPVLQVTLTQIPPLESLPFFLGLGILSGGVGWIFNASLVETTRRLSFQSFRANLLKVIVAGAVLAITGWFYPSLLGGGLPLTNRALSGEGTINWLLLMFLLRFALSIGSYAVGTAGGIFAPLLVLGGLMGLFVGELSHRVFPTAVPETAAFAVVGMAALFASVVRCPLTGIVLIIEMTGHYELIIPLMVASFAASITADELHSAPVYDALLELQLKSNSATDRPEKQPVATE